MTFVVTAIPLDRNMFCMYGYQIFNLGFVFCFLPILADIQIHTQMHHFFKGFRNNIHLDQIFKAESGL